MSESNNSQKSILKSTGIVGGAQVISIFINIFRIKVIALLLGPSGVGLIGMFQSATDLVKQITSFGISYSGVKEIADANNKGVEVISRKVTIVKRWSLYTGVLGMFITILLCLPLSKFAFDSSKYTWSIAILSITLLASSISNGQLTILQGLRQINQSAKATIASSVIGLFFSVPLYWILGEKGIVPSLLLISLVTLISSWHFIRKYRFASVHISFNDTITEGLSLAKLGFFILSTSILVTFTLFSIRATIAEKMDLNAVGCFHAVFSITSLYLGIIFNAMQLDFYPKLSALESDEKANELMNHQIEVALIISTPILMLLIVFSELVIRIILSPSFLFGSSVMQWQLFGGFFGILSWALGVMFLARGKGVYSLISEGFWCFIYYIFIFFTWESFGFLSLGIGYVVAGFLRLFVVLYFTKKISLFSFEKSVHKTIIIFGVLIFSLFINVQLMSGLLKHIVSILLISISLYLSYKKISSIVNIHILYKKIINKFGLI